MRPGGCQEWRGTVFAMSWAPAEDCGRPRYRDGPSVTNRGAGTRPAAVTARRRSSPVPEPVRLEITTRLFCTPSPARRDRSSSLLRKSTPRRASQRPQSPRRGRYVHAAPAPSSNAALRAPPPPYTTPSQAAPRRDARTLKDRNYDMMRNVIEGRQRFHSSFIIIFIILLSRSSPACCFASHSCLVISLIGG